MTTLQTLRIPRGLWTDIEETVIQQDRQFLTEVARSLGLPVPEVLRRCLGTGAPHAILTGSADTEICPWWNLSVDGLWQPCGRLRLTPTSPCQLHQIPGSAALGSSLSHLPTLQPVKYNGEIYWIGDDVVYRENGRVESDIQFKFIDHQGQRICIAVRSSG